MGEVPLLLVARGRARESPRRARKIPHRVEARPASRDRRCANANALERGSGGWSRHTGCAYSASTANRGFCRASELTIGATANQNGTAIYEGVTVLFLAQLAGVDLSMGQQVMVAYLAILGSVGTAGVPSGSIPFIVLVLASIHVNPALIAVILGVDRILDMCRTTLNVT
ncbi:cation:dicarboxylase symporter family transporter, partial [bacterium]|nr:cation:dicarboxylase symporter family transporter [bacterium]